MAEIWRELTEAAPTIGQKRDVKRIGPILHMDPAHKVMVTIEAPNQDALVDHLQETRLGMIQDIEIYRLTPMENLFKQAAEWGHQPLY